MRMHGCIILLLFLSLAGCGQKKHYDGPTVDAFRGRLVHDGKPVSFPDNEEVILELGFHGTGRRYGIPIAADGSFKIGWMPIGKYSPTLLRTDKEGKKVPLTTRYKLPGEFTIEEGKTEYTVELGKGWKP
jgi:hypothetical protein